MTDITSVQAFTKSVQADGFCDDSQGFPTDEEHRKILSSVERDRERQFLLNQGMFCDGYNPSLAIS